MAEQRGEDRGGAGDRQGQGGYGEVPSEPPGPAGPPGAGAAEAEQFRQFQEFQQFQQFQEYLRRTEGQRHSGGGELVPVTQHQPVPQVPQPGYRQPPPLPPHAGPAELPGGRPRPRVPRWLRRLGRKLIGLAVLLLLLGLGLTIAYNHFFGTNDDEDRPAAETGGGTYRTNHILSTNPYGAVRSLYDGIAQNVTPAKACGRMREDIQQQFAMDLGYGDCAQAVAGLRTQVTNMNDYLLSVPFGTPEPVPGDTIQISSCTVGIKGGPSLGVFTVSKVEKGQWLITGHSNEPACAKPSSSGIRPTG